MAGDKLRRRAPAACADAERIRGVAWLEPRLKAKINYSEMMHLVEHGEAFEHDDTSNQRISMAGKAYSPGFSNK
jgi:hypothetical protein